MTGVSVTIRSGPPVADWRSQASCGMSDLNFFTTDSILKYAARALCKSECPVRLQCLNFALKNKEIHGIWGGCDDYELRRALSVNSLGVPVIRVRKPRCPYCSRMSIKMTEKKRSRVLVECTRCNLSWWIRRPQREKVPVTVIE